MSDHKEIKKKIKQQLSAMSNEALIQEFNNKVGLRYYNTYLGQFYLVLENELLSRGWDCSSIITKNPITNIESLSLAFPVIIHNNKLIVIKNYFWFENERVYLN